MHFSCQIVTSFDQGHFSTASLLAETIHGSKEVAMVEEEAVGDIRGVAASSELNLYSWTARISGTTIFTYAPNSTYQANLNTLLSVLSFNSNASTGFFNFTAGSSPPDVAYGFFLCREDVSVAVCRECIISASRDAVDKCPRSKRVTIWHEKCMLRCPPDWGSSPAAVLKPPRKKENLITEDIGGVRKDGPRILKFLAGIDTHLMIELLSHSISSDCPNRSNRIHSHAPPASFFAFPAADAIADAIELLADAAGRDLNRRRLRWLRRLLYTAAAGRPAEG
ncbi:hypothetical protein C3L33_11400, partial [Rhododendron williamsianum]